MTSFKCSISRGLYLAKRRFKVHIKNDIQNQTKYYQDLAHLGIYVQSKLEEGYALRVFDNLFGKEIYNGKDIIIWKKIFRRITNGS